ncbi:MAG TPA: hypothetical protein VLS47_05700 [Gallionella sp.]|nr:hypothetical protein [Gallionella sp.]
MLQDAEIIHASRVRVRFSAPAVAGWHFEDRAFLISVGAGSASCAASVVTAIGAKPIVDASDPAAHLYSV